MQNKGLFILIVEFCTDCLCVNRSTKCLKDFIGQLNIDRIIESQYEVLFRYIVSSLAIILTAKNPGGVFIFKGNSNSGIALKECKSLPKDGYCFCGFIRLEHQVIRNKMIIFKLTGSQDIEFYVEEKHLFYQVLFAKKA